MFAKLGQLDVASKLKQNLCQLGQWHGMKDSPVLWRNSNHHPIIGSGDIPSQIIAGELIVYGFIAVDVA